MASELGLADFRGGLLTGVGGGILVDFGGALVTDSVVLTPLQVNLVHAAFVLLALILVVWGVTLRKRIVR